MKKGDLRKQEILKTAEVLFCQKGYQQTSIQDILNIMNSSKGSFYHHFDSKEALLEGICGKRAEQIHHSVIYSIDHLNGFLHNLNVFLSGMIPFRDEKLDFLLMLLPILDHPDGRLVGLYYCDALSCLFLPDVTQLLQSGPSQGFYCSEPAITADLILSLVNRLWVRICKIIITAEKNNYEPDISEILQTTEIYRISIERILSLPYGSIELIDIPTIRSLCEQIHKHWLQ